MDKFVEESDHFLYMRWYDPAACARQEAIVAALLQNKKATVTPSCPDNICSLCKQA